MDFSHSPQAQQLSQRLEAFLQRYLLPYNPAWHRSVQDGVYPPLFLEDLKNVTNAAQAAVGAQISAIKVVAAWLQTRVVDRAMQVFGAMGLSPDTPLAQFWSWGRALHLMDGPDEVHLRSVARHELAQARTRTGALGAWFTTPGQLQAPPRIR